MQPFKSILGHSALLDIDVHDQASFKIAFQSRFCSFEKVVIYSVRASKHDLLILLFVRQLFTSQRKNTWSKRVNQIKQHLSGEKLLRVIFYSRVAVCLGYG